jgi:predicted DNA-binding transcriptional regulator YafY
VGQRGAAESISAILQAFLRRRTWKQADLAETVGIKVPALRNHVNTLITQGFPIEREEEHPHVYLSVPRDWFPGGVVFAGEEVSALLRQLARSPATKERDALIATIVECLAGDREALAARTRVVQPKAPSPSEAAHLSIVEDAAAGQVTLHCQYYSSRGSEGWRYLSVQRVIPGPPARFVAYCHRTQRLKWFRVDNVLRAELAPDENYHLEPQAAVDDMVRVSLDGFYEDGDAAEYRFVVREPEARWVKKNLIDGMEVVDLDRGIRVQVKTTALPRLARFVVGLGAAATPQTPELAEAVAELARGALAAIDAAKAPEGG